MSMNRMGRKSAPEAAASGAVPETISGNRGLAMEEALLFDIGRVEVSGVDLPDKALDDARLGGLARKSEIGLPGLSEPECMRHYVRLSSKNYAIDAGLYPLGSCTMKHNPRANEKMARLPGFADIHPLQPQSTVQGALELMDRLAHWLKVLTGMPAVSLSPKAGAHGELTGMMAIRSAHIASGEDDRRKRVLVPESAHGTNPATAALLGYSISSIDARADGTVGVREVLSHLGDDIAGIMLTNPNTCGLFERDIIEIADAVHEAGGYFYCDGANFNAIMGRVRPGDLGIDAMHLNLHKTFSTPHGGGGPGSGPVMLSEALAPYSALPLLEKTDGGFALVEETPEGGESLGRVTAFHGQMGMYVRALTYMLAHGGDGLRQASEDAVLNANYLRAQLRDVMTQPFGDQACMHEVLFDDSFLKGTEVSTLDFAKALIDEGYHPMTIYFPLVVHGAMLVEPTESEPKASLDNFIEVMRGLVDKAKDGDKARFSQAPQFTPRGRLDETRAARSPVLRWTPELKQSAEAAE